MKLYTFVVLPNESRERKHVLVLTQRHYQLRVNHSTFNCCNVNSSGRSTRTIWQPLILWVRVLRVAMEHRWLDGETWTRKIVEQLLRSSWQLWECSMQSYGTRNMNITYMEKRSCLNNKLRIGDDLLIGKNGKILI